nr:immunoglobulin light chain junction region [Macaca mulatta]MPO03517.1 immunoglobulin light chain junction region [Macaca mulatta]MPO03914.1 immunoglobulin light chain junction region [Macaca mulatta]MPO04491.1 immunoglobulin light chain junction region [Macaca mulatta]MPO04750.1 immunoglobulin light chain junction region [Macaca mulatta]
CCSYTTNSTFIF